MCGRKHYLNVTKKSKELQKNWINCIENNNRFIDLYYKWE